MTTSAGLAAQQTGLGLSADWLLAVGGAVLLLAVAWRTSRAVRIRAVLRSALRSDDPLVRADAVAHAGEVGLATNAKALLRVVHSEDDPAVLRAVTRTVAARQWEPASTAAVVELRLWARAFIDRHPELRPAAPVGPPLLAGVAGVAVVPSLDPERSGKFQRKTDTHSAAVPENSGALGHHPAVDDPDALGQTRVLVTGAGGAAGVSVIQALRERGHYVIAADADPLAAGLRLGHESHVLPVCTDPVYVAALVRASTVSNVQAIICTVAEEYPALIAAKAFLDEAGVRTLLPDADAVRRCTDKWAFHETTVAAGLPVPSTTLAELPEGRGPWIVKPRYGRGSRDVVLCTNRVQLKAALAAVPDPIVQTRLTGREFTCDALVDPSGVLVGAVPRWRLATKAGISVKGETFESAEVEHVSGLVLKAVGLLGPANVQGFVADDGTVTIHEVNPRFSGGLPLSLAAGADLVEEHLRAIMGLPMRPERLVARPGVRMMRYFSEIIEQ
jgi:carbamoyl-phosphate synthase large subunit